MEKVFIYNEILGLKGTAGFLHEVNAKGYYVTVIRIKEKRHRVLLPVQSTVIIYSEPIMEVDNALDLE